MIYDLKSSKRIYCPSKVFVRSIDYHFQYESRSNRFTLPKGRYEILSEYPITFIPKVRPKYHRFIRKEIPKDWSVKIDYGSNPKKATIWKDYETKRAKILFDNNIAYLSYPTKLYIYLHELGHIYYEDEDKCDMYAENCMLKMGFNPSQILGANLDSGNLRECLPRFQKFILL